jgi:hypothetical protein
LHGCAVAEAPPPQRDAASDVVLEAIADFDGTALSALQTRVDDDNTIEGTAEEIEDATGCASHPKPARGCRYCARVA